MIFPGCISCQDVLIFCLASDILGIESFWEDLKKDDVYIVPLYFLVKAIKFNYLQKQFARIALGV